MNNKIYEIAILARVTWNLHSLNNEGNIGNVIEPRSITLADGTMVDGISGEMLKHIHAAKIWELAPEDSQFCEVCRVLEPMRADENPNVKRISGDDKEQRAVRQALTDCVLCDLHGFLVQKPAVSRKSTVEFGWVVGVPGQWHRAIHQHARHAVGYKGKGKGGSDDSVDDEQPRDEKKTSQMVYNRPTRSGQYALVSVLQPWRIGLNTVNYSYDIEIGERKSRYQLALRAYEAMIMRTTGAMTSTRLPHTEDVQGVIVVSRTNFPVPVISSLKEAYRNELAALTEASSANFDLHPFGSLVEFVQGLNTLKDNEPFSLTKTQESKNG